MVCIAPICSRASAHPFARQVRANGRAAHVVAESDPNAITRTIPCPAGPPACPLGAITADGVLDCEARLVLDLNGNGIPDVLETRRGAAFFQL
jgi:hypothetical protein